MAGWERLASRSGGTVPGLATAMAADGTTLVFAATAAGIRRSADGGETWTPVGAGNHVPFAEAVAPAPGFAADRTLFAAARDGLYRWSDGGQSWQRTLFGSRMLSLAVSPDEEGRALLLAGTETDGVLRSSDAGRTWTNANPGLLDLTVLALALSPHFERDRVGFAATPSGLYRTRNGASSWRAVETGFDESAVQCLAVSPSFADDRLVLAGTVTAGLLRSDDGGTTWQVVPDLPRDGITALAFSAGYAARPTIAAATDDGLAVSHDGGRTWRTTGRELGPVLSLIFVPRAAGERLLAGLPRLGIARSDDHGATWAPANDGLSASLLVGLVLSPAFARDATLFTAGLQDGVSVSTDGGRTWTDRNDGLEDSTVYGLAASSDYARDRTLYAATSAGVQRSPDGGASWCLIPAPGPAAPARAVATGPAGGDGPPTVLAALEGGELLASADGGERWGRLGRPFGDAEVISLALSPGYARDRTILVGTARRAGPGEAAELVLWRSLDGGQRWERWLVERGGDVLPLAVPPEYSIDQLAFAGVGRRVLRPLRDWREVRSGQRRPVWRAAELDGAMVTALAASPRFRDDLTLFAGSSAGVFVSRNGGETFQPWSEGLAPSAIVALAISPRYRHDRLVYALGLGGTVWRGRDAS